jgi:peroxiredoxin Q/BCP
MAARKTRKKTAKKPAKKPAKKTRKKSAKKPARKAAAVSTPLDDGGSVSLKDLRGKRVVLYFYPKDDTPGCTVEACAFRDQLPDFSRLGATVIGVSKDDTASHQRFKQKFSLTFPLASDTSGVCEKYGVWKLKSMYGRTYLGIERSTFLIDEAGRVRAEWRKVSVTGHADEVRSALQGL